MGCGANGLPNMGFLQSKNSKKIAKVLLWLFLTPILLFVVLAALLYVPPIQRWAAHIATEKISKTTGFDVTLDNVRLRFPLDFDLNGLVVADKGDTLLNARTARFDVEVFPLFKGQANVNGISLYVSKIDTRDLVGNTRICGNVGKLSAQLRGFNWKTEKVVVPTVDLRESDLAVVLTDTVLDDADKSAAHWDIAVDKATLSDSHVRLAMESLPADLPAPRHTKWVAANIEKAELIEGRFDTGSGNYSFKHLNIEKSAAAYNAKGLAGEWTEKQPVPPLPADKVNTETNRRRNALAYSDRMAELRKWNPFSPDNQPGSFDPDNIVVEDINVKLDTLSYNPKGQLRAGIRSASLRERSGLSVDNVSGPLYLDSERVKLPSLSVKSGNSTVNMAIDLPWSALESGNIGGSDLDLNIDADLAPADVKRLGKDFLPKDVLRNYPNRNLHVQGRVGGNMDNLRIKSLRAEMPSVFVATTKGTLNDMTGKNPRGNIDFNLTTGPSFNSVAQQFVPAMRGSVRIPASTNATGHLAFNGDNYDINTIVSQQGGKMAVKAKANLAAETYTASIDSRSFPVSNFLVGTKAGRLTGKVSAIGHHFDVLSPKAQLTAKADIDKFSFEGYDLDNLALDARLKNGNAQVDFEGDNSLLAGNGQLTAKLGNRWDGRLRGNFEKLNLKALGLTDEEMVAGGNVNVKFDMASNLSDMNVSGDVGNIFFSAPDRGFTTQDIAFNFTTAHDTTHVRLNSGDLLLNASTKGDLQSLMSQVNKFTSLLQKQLADRSLDYWALKNELPDADIHLEASRRNPFYQYLRLNGVEYNTALVDLHTHPVSGLEGEMRIDSLVAKGMVFDRVNLKVDQDSTGILLNGLVKNDSPRNKNKFEARLDGQLRGDAAQIGARFFDAEGIEALNIGARADFLVDRGIRLSLYPQHPILAYRDFTINSDNYVFLGKNKELFADIDLLADDGTGLKVFSTGNDSVNDITLSLHHVNLGELSAIVPYMPDMKGLLSGDIHINENHTDFTAMATLQADGFEYEGTPFGRLGADITYMPQGGNTHYASAILSTGDREVMTAEGTYYDQDETIKADGTLYDFPMALLNGFMEGTDVAFKGTAAGNFDISGTVGSPKLNGALNMGDTHVYSDVYGFDFQLDSINVPIRDSKLRFTDYNLRSKGNNPLVVNGTVDASRLDHIALDLTMRAKNFELINAEKQAKSLVFGKLYADFIGSLTGTVDKMNIRGKLDVLDNTDVTYILRDSPLAMENRLEDIVQFVDFTNPEAEPEPVVVSSNSMNMVLGIGISDAARFHCFLTEDGKSYVDMVGGGDLTLRLTEQGETRLTGRLTVQEGQLNYEMPIIPLRTFNIAQGSTVDFTGEPGNPTLNIVATERMKATVSDDTQQRTVAFDVGVKLTKPLDQMGLEFTIDAPEDIDTQNQLASMSQEQRTKVAVAMMATGMYITDNSSMTSGFKMSNALNAFLQSEIQNIAGSALKTIDINFGIESGTSAVGTQTTDYSFQFAKRFWDDRIRVIIGGRVSSGADADNHAESIINNVSVEYRINKGASRFVRVFYDRDLQDPLEGQLTKTGVGYSVRRKAEKFGDLFIFWKKKEPVRVKPVPEVPTDSIRPAR